MYINEHKTRIMNEIKIGNLVWATSNLNVSKFRNGALNFKKTNNVCLQTII